MTTPQSPQTWHDEAKAKATNCESLWAHYIKHPSLGTQAAYTAARDEFDAHLSARPEAQPAPVFDLQGGLDNQELAEAWDKKLPGVKPSDEQLTAFALGIECGTAMASEKRAKADDYDRVADLARLRRAAMEKAGLDPWVHKEAQPAQEGQALSSQLEPLSSDERLEGQAEAVPEFGSLQVYPQPSWHSSARIVGDRAGLLILRAAIDKALKDGDARAETLFPSDGEGYDIDVSSVSAEAFDAFNPFYADFPESTHPSPPAQAPEGWKLVPMEPTEAMCKAAVIFANGTAVYKNVAADALKIEEAIYGEAYSAMLSAAPTPPLDDSSYRKDAERVRRLQDAIEGECDGLAITEDRARAILEYLDTGAIDAAMNPQEPK